MARTKRNRKGQFVKRRRRPTKDEVLRYYKKIGIRDYPSRARSRGPRRRTVQRRGPRGADYSTRSYYLPNQALTPSSNPPPTSVAVGGPPPMLTEKAIRHMFRGGSPTAVLSDTGADPETLAVLNVFGGRAIKTTSTAGRIFAWAFGH